MAIQRRENAGIDFGFFRNRIRGSLDVYQRTATDRLDFNPLPFNSPIDVVADNVGSTQGYGVELSLHTKHYKPNNKLGNRF